jgi:hypothetical protein
VIIQDRLFPDLCFIDRIYTRLIHNVLLLLCDNASFW